MTREKEIRQASIDYQLSTKPMAIGGDAFADSISDVNVNHSFMVGAEWADKTMIEKACKWLSNMINSSKNAYELHGMYGIKTEIVINNFRKAMEK